MNEVSAELQHMPKVSASLLMPYGNASMISQGCEKSALNNSHSACDALLPATSITGVTAAAFLAASVLRSPGSPFATACIMSLVKSRNNAAQL